MQITIRPGNWGGAPLGHIKELLDDVASHILLHLRKPMTGIVEVIPATSPEQDPETFYRVSRTGPYVIRLNVEGWYWAQFAYQFSHELCHILSDYERLGDNPNNWFHEAICELASIFVLRSMAKSWTTNPPHLHQSSFAKSLAEYADRRLNLPDRKLPVGRTITEWLAAEEEQLRKDRYQRDKNAIVAYTFVPLFESEPAGWNVVRNMPSSSTTLGEYLIEWYERVESADNLFVRRILDVFELHSGDTTRIHCN